MVSEYSRKHHKNAFLRLEIKLAKEDANTGDCDSRIAQCCLEHVALAWCVRFPVHIMSRTAKGAGGLTAFQRAFQRTSHPRAMPSAQGEKIL